MGSTMTAGTVYDVRYDLNVGGINIEEIDELLGADWGQTYHTRCVGSCR
ncbi:MAG: hypothetical protein K0U72_06955 [Gammaproteobacteria bacterium]|nr:hypothetical protein [Gammaproteobacteria bacterium]